MERMNIFAPRDAQNEGHSIARLFDVRSLLNVAAMEAPTLVRRVPDSTSSGSSATTACSSSTESDTCQKPVNNTGLPIALGVAVPLTVALVCFLYFHRRYRQKLRAEDKADEEKYKSMDFGMDLNYGGKKKGGKNRGPQPTTEIARQQHIRGLSLEDGQSPYFFRGAGRTSVESLQSLGNSIRNHHDPYTAHLGGKVADELSIRSPSPLTRRGTESSGYSHLLGHAQGNPNSKPPRVGSLPPPPDLPPTIQEPEKAMLAANEYRPVKQANTGGLAAPANDQSRESYMDHQAFRKSNNYLGNFIHSRDPSVDPLAAFEDFGDTKATPDTLDSTTSTLLGSEMSNKEMFPLKEHSLPTNTVLPEPPQLPTQHVISNTAEKHDAYDKFSSVQGSMHDANHSSYNTSAGAEHQRYMSQSINYDNFGDAGFKVTPPSPPRHSQNSMGSDPRHPDQRNSNMSRGSGSNYGDNNYPSRGQSLAAPMPEIQEHHEPHDYHQGMDEGLRDLDFNTNRLSVFMRPLPPDDPSEDPETRANRIRSFYKEYFDDSKGGHGPPPQMYAPQPQSHGGYYEDYDSEYLGNGYSVYDEQQRGFIVGGAPFAQPITRRAMTPPPRAPPRNFRGRSSSNAPGPRGPPSRAGSSMSGYATPPRMGSSMSNYSRGRAPKKNLPPPAALMSLKTPALLKEDSALYGAFDLAPPPSYRQRQNGMRPDSPLGTERPYSPTVRAHTPLQSAFEDLSPMPSPHLLRKSGTFTALDFAPIPRFRGADTGSDAASIRSGGSGMSSGQLYAMRQGAHRLSRLQKDLAGTRDDITASLKPKWDLTY